MKRTYTKPLIAMESFQLNAAIAGACKDDGKHLLNHYQSTCNALDIDKGETGDVFFGLACAATGVDVTAKDWQDEGGLCYHGPTVDLANVYLAS